MPKEAKEKNPVYSSYLTKFNEGNRRVSLIKLAGLNIFIPSQFKKLKDEKKYSIEAIDALYLYSRRLITYPYDLSSDQILKIASFKDGHFTIAEVHKEFETLKSWGLSTEQILGMANKHYGWNNIRIMTDLYNPKKDLGNATDKPKILNPSEIVTTAPVPETPNPLIGFERENPDFVDGLGFMAYCSPSDLLLSPAPFPTSNYRFNLS